MSNNIVPIGESKNQRPSNSAFKQQKLSAWQPILTAGTVLPTFFLIGVAFIPVGIGLLISSSKVYEFEHDYTSCQRVDPTSNNTAPVLCSEFIATHRDTKEECKCEIEFQLDTDIKRDVFIYYGLNNFYQNHRRYVKSRSDYQLLGHLKIGHECDPFSYRLDPVDQLVKQVAPCGAIANSFFNDTFKLERRNSKEDKYRSVPFVETGIAWATDKKNKFHNPSLKGSSNLQLAFNGTIKPANWPEPVYELDKHDPSNNGFQNERFIVWMRTSAFPTFRKLYGRIAHDRKDSEEVDYQDSLPKGQYRVTITYNFPVAEFKGKKRFIISNTSWLGGKNPFIGAVYIFVGISALILSAIFLLIHKKFSKNSADNFNITTQTPFIVNS